MEGLQYQPNLPLLHQGLACEDGTSGSDRDEYAMMDQEILDSELMELAMNTYKFQFGDTGHISYAPNNTHTQDLGAHRDNVFNNALLQGV